MKVEAVRGYGARIVFSGNAPEDRERTLDEVSWRRPAPSSSIPPMTFA